MREEVTIHPDAHEKFFKEPSFEIFTHAQLLCCIQRHPSFGTLNGYVAVDEKHPFYHKMYSDNVVVDDLNEVEFNGNYIGLLCNTMDDKPDNMLSIDLVFKVHGGITYSNSEVIGIAADLFEKLWWFGFDTCHSGDLKVYQSETERRFDFGRGGTYRDFRYLKDQTKLLAEQLSKYLPIIKP